MELPFPAPASLAPGFVLSPMTPADTDAAAVVYYESFKLDPANTYWWPKDLAPLLTWCSGRMRKKLDDPDVRIFKITDAAMGDMVAYARWDVPKDSTKFGAWTGGENAKVDVTALVESDNQAAGAADEATMHQPLTADDEAAPAVGEYPEGGNHEIAEMFFSALSESQKKWSTDDMLGELCQFAYLAPLSFPLQTHLLKHMETNEYTKDSHCSVFHQNTTGGDSRQLSCRPCWTSPMQRAGSRTWRPPWPAGRCTND